MRSNRIIGILSLLTVMAVLYVHQHVEIVKSGYMLQKNRKYLSCLVDQNSKLMYNLSKIESPRYLLASLDREEIKFAGRRTRQSDSYTLVRGNTDGRDREIDLVGRFLDLFTVNAEAGPRR